MIPELNPEPFPRLAQLRFTLRTGGTIAEAPKRLMRDADPFRWRLRKQIGRWLFWRFGMAAEPVVCASPTHRGGIMFGWYLPGGASFRVHLSSDRGAAVITHGMKSAVFGPTQSNARLFRACDMLAGAIGGER